MSDNGIQFTGQYHNKGNVFQIMIVSLAILEKNIGMYPPGHVAITFACEELLSLLGSIFSETYTITILSVKNSLVINYIPIEANNLRIRNFSQLLSRRGIASIIISSGVTSTELVTFFQLITSIPLRSQIQHHTDISNALEALPHIRAKALDLTGIRFEETNSSRKSSHKSSHLTIWDKLIFGCLSNESADSKIDGDLSIHDTSINDAKLSFNQLRETYRVTDEKIAESYQSVFNEHFHHVASEEGQISDKQSFFSSILDALPEFSPGLKEQILSITFEQINSSIEEKSLEELLTCIPGELVNEVLEQAKRLKTEISPSLMKLVGAISRIRQQNPDIQESPTSQMAINQNQIQKLFEREMYEHYVPQEYSSELYQLSMGGHNPMAPQNLAFPLDDYIKTLSDSYINQRMVNGLLTIIDTNIEPLIYSDFLDCISALSIELLQGYQFQTILTSYRLLLDHATSKSDQKSRYAATNALKAFSDQAFIRTLSEVYQIPGQASDHDLRQLIIASGPKNIPWLLDNYISLVQSQLSSVPSKLANATESQQLLPLSIDLLLQFGSLATDEIIYRLSQDDVSKSLALLKLVKDHSDPRLMQGIRKMLESDSNEVRLETIQLLLKNQDPVAIAALGKLLTSRDETIAINAFYIVREFKVKELAQELAGLIRIKLINASDIKRNQLILEVLDTLANPIVLPVLTKIAHAKLTLTPRRLKQTQVILYQTLGHYPAASTQNLFNFGKGSKNPLISAICSRRDN